MTPTQLRAFAAGVRRGSVKEAGTDLGVSGAAISLQVAQLRKELGDQLSVRTSAGLAFTPGGLRLASRAAEMLGLQDRTILEVSQAGAGRRLLRVAASTLFAEHCMGHSIVTKRESGTTGSAAQGAFARMYRSCHG